MSGPGLYRLYSREIGIDPYSRESREIGIGIEEMPSGGNPVAGGASLGGSSSEVDSGDGDSVEESGHGVTDMPTSRDMPTSGNGHIRARGSTDTIVWALRSEPGEVRPHNEDFAATSIPCNMHDTPPDCSCNIGSSQATDGGGCQPEYGYPRTCFGYCKGGQPDQAGQSLEMDLPLFMVADGLGGHDGGEVASSVAAYTVMSSWRKVSYPLSQAMRSSIRKANAAVFGAAYEYNHQGMATTITALALNGNEAVIAHVGDSRAYMVRRGRAEQLTNDHSQVAEMLRRGLLTPEQAANHPARSMLTRCIGLAPAVSVDLIRREFSRGDIFVLCTDGLWDMVSRQEIGEMSAGLSIESSPSDVEKVVDQMINTALERGAADNVTAVVIVAVDNTLAVESPYSGGFFRRWMHR